MNTGSAGASGGQGDLPLNKIWPPRQRAGSS